MKISTSPLLLLLFVLYCNAISQNVLAQASEDTRTISVTLIAPASETFPESRGLKFFISSFTSDGHPIGTNGRTGSNPRLLPDNNSVTFNTSIQVRQGDLVADYFEISAGCTSNCGAIFDRVYFDNDNKAGNLFIGEYEPGGRIPVSNIGSSVSLLLRNGRIFDGTFFFPDLPDSEIVGRNIWFNITDYKENGEQLSERTYSAIRTVSEANSSADFRLVIPQVDEGGYYIASYGCRSTGVTSCKTLLTDMNNFYTPDGNVYLDIPDPATAPRIDHNDLPFSDNLEVEDSPSITGSISLPEGQTALEDTELYVEILRCRMENFSACNGFRLIPQETNTPVVTIKAGESSARFEIKRPADNSGFFRFTYGCLDTQPNSPCDQLGNYLGTHYFDPNTAELFKLTENDQFLTVDQLPTSAVQLRLANKQYSFNLIRTSVVEGLETPTMFQFDFTTFDQNLNQVSHVQRTESFSTSRRIFANMPYDLKNATSGVIKVTCITNCKDTPPEYYILRTELTAQIVYSEALAHSDIDTLLKTALGGFGLGIPIAQTLNASISLPEPAGPNGMEVSLRIFSIQPSLQGIDYDTTQIQLMAAGDTQSDFSFRLPPYDTGEYVIQASCVSNCPDNFVEHTFYHPSGLTNRPQDAAFDVAALPSTLNIELLKLNGLSGTVSLPEARDSDVTLQINIESYDADQNLINSQPSQVIVPANNVSQNYSINYLPANEGQFYVINFSCESNCDGLLSDAVIQADGGLNPSLSDGFISIDDMPSVLNLALPNTLSLGGSLRLPNSLNASAVQASVSLAVLNPAGQIIERFTQSIEFASGDNSAAIDIDYFLGDDDLRYVIEFGCDANCGNLLESGFFNPSLGFTTDFSLAAFSADLIPATVDLELIEIQSVDISLSSASFNNANPSRYDVFVNYYDAQQQFIGAVAETYAFNAQQTTITKTFDLTPPQNGFVEVRYECVSSCMQVVSPAFFTPNDEGGNASGFMNSSRIPSAQLPSSIHLAALQGNSLSGTVTLATGVAVGGDIDGDVILRRFGAGTDGETFFGRFTISEQSNQGTYVMNLPAPATNDLYTLEYGCTDNCDGVATQLFSTPSGQALQPLRGQFDPSFAASTLPETLNLTLLSSADLMGTIRLPQGVATQAIELEVSVVAFSQVEVFDALFASTETITINQNESEAAYQINYPIVENVDYAGLVTCRSGCGNFLQNMFHNIDGKFGFSDTARFTQENFPARIDFVLTEQTHELLGTFLRPADASNDELLAGFLSVIRYDSNQNFIEAFVNEVDIPQAQDSTPFSLSFISQSNEEFIDVFYGCADPCFADGSDLLDLYYRDALPTFNMLEAPNRVGSLPSNIVVQLYDEVNVSSRVTLLNTVATNNMEFMLRLQATDPETQQSINQVKVVNVPQGQSTASFDINSIVDASLSYNLSALCTRNCGDFSQRVYAGLNGSTLDLASASVTLGQLDQLGEIELQAAPPQLTRVAIDGFLPNDITSQLPMELSLTVSLFDGEGNPIINSFGAGSFTTNAIIDTGNSSAAMILQFEEEQPAVSYEVGISCENNCGGFVDRFIGINGELSEMPVKLDLSQLNALSRVIFEIARTSFNGLISLPRGETATQNIPVRLDLTHFGDEDQFLNRVSTDAVILAGQSSVHISAPIDSTASSFQAAFGCVSRTLCNGLLPNDDDSVSQTFFTNSGGVASETSGFSLRPDPEIVRIQAAELLNLYEGELVRLNKTRVRFNPPELLSSLDARFDVLFTTINAEGRQIFTKISTMPTSELEGEVEFYAEEGASYEISFDCVDFFSSTSRCLGVKPPSNPVELSSAPLITDLIELTFLAGIELDVLATADIPAQETVSVFADVTTVDAAGTEIATTTVSDFLRPDDDGQSSIRTVATAPEGGGYQFTIQCRASFGSSACGNYLANHPSYSFFVTPEEAQSVIELRLLARSIEIDPFEVDDDIATANRIDPNRTQEHTIHLAGDIDWVRFRVERGDNDIRLVAQSREPTDGAVVITLFNQEQTLIAESDGNVEQTFLDGLPISEVALESLPEGDYFVRVAAAIETGLNEGYTLSLTITRQDDGICIPIKLKNGGITVVCF